MLKNAVCSRTYVYDQWGCTFLLEYFVGCTDSDEAQDKAACFEIKVCKQSEEEKATACISIVGCGYDNVLTILDYLSKNAVTPTSVCDVLEDIAFENKMQIKTSVCI